MDKNSISCPWGDCPGLNSGPKSKEHEGRFVNWGTTASQSVNNTAGTMIKVNTTRNPVK